MAFKISKADQKRIDDLFEKFKSKVDGVQSAIDELNEVRDEIRGVVEDIKDEMQGQFDERSEAWQNGDRADPTTAWIEALGEHVSTMETEIEMPDLSEFTDKIDEGVPAEPEY